eukprot:11560073-Alexandrium_andersonii.AAC.1
MCIRDRDVEAVGGSDVQARVRGLPVPVVAAAVRHLGAHAWLDGGASRPCERSVKSALVPAHSVFRWQDALVALPFSPENV